MRSRNIKPGFWENETIGRLTHTQRLLFIGLWCIADREGKLENRPDRIKHLIFGYDKQKIDVHGELTVMARLGLVNLYEVNGMPIIIIPKFKKHQSPHHTERRSNLPDPQSNSESHGELTVSHGENPPDSLNHESRIMNHNTPYSPPKGDNHFEVFWKAYPNKKGKKAALRAWGKAKDRPPIEVMLKALDVQKMSTSWKKEDGQYIPHPATWLNQGRWGDEIEANIHEAKNPTIEELDKRGAI